MPSKCAPATGLQSVLLTGLGYQRFDRVAGLRTLGEPVVNAFQIEIDFMGIADGIVRSEHFDATAIAPTVAGILRIRSPNGARTRPLSF